MAILSGIYSVTSILILRVEPEIFEVLDLEKIMVGLSRYFFTVLELDFLNCRGVLIHHPDF